MTAHEDYAIRCERLSRTYPGNQVAVSELALDVKRGEVFGFLGPNGAGKSTTTRMLCGLLRPSSGTAVVAGIDIAHDPEAVKRRIGYVAQAFSFYADLTAAENMAFASRLYRVPAAVATQRRAELIERTGFGPHAGKLAKALSGGWKQKLAICCALLHDPEILFLDEPTAGIDPVSRRDIWELLLDLAGRGKTIFVTTHYMDEAERCDNVGFMFMGKLVAYGNPRSVESSFNGGRILEVRASSTIGALRALQQRPELGTAQVFYDTIHVVHPEIERITPLVRAAIESQGMAVHSMTTVVPSLEDIFIHFIHDAKR
jgi:ABC-2 type transport system ATP-binding protein